MGPFSTDEVYVGRDMGGNQWTLSSDAIENYIAGSGDDHHWYTAGSPLGD